LGSFEIMQTFQLVVHRNQLAPDVFRAVQLREPHQRCFDARFGLDQEATVGCSRFVGHRSVVERQANPSQPSPRPQSCQRCCCLSDPMG